jgi:DNA-binding MarR family transcriptional regulator
VSLGANRKVWLAQQNTFVSPTIYTADIGVKGAGAVTAETDNGGHSAVCLRLMRVFPRVMRGMRRYQDQTTPQTPAPLGPRHVAALEQLRDGPLSVGVLADRLGLTLSTVSGVLAGLDLAGFVERSADRADRRRTIVQIAPGAAPVVREWLDGAAAPLARVLDKLGADERAAFIKAMDMLEAEFRASDEGPGPGAGALPQAATPPANPG